MSDHSAFTHPQNDDIAKLAYRYWEEGGRDHGHDREHWLRAEAELNGRRESRGREDEAEYEPQRITGRTAGERFPARYSTH